MNDDVLAIDQNAIRGTDTNSLLRLYDRAHAILSLAAFQQQRTQAERVVERVAKELQKRNVSVSAGPSATDPIPRLETLPVAGA